jgi:ribonuclease J
MARVHFLDGAECIGGTKLLLEDDGVHLLFDFGTNYDAEGHFFGYDRDVKKMKYAFKDRFYRLQALGLLPPIPPSVAGDDGAEGRDPNPYFCDHVTTDAEYDELPPAGVHGIFLSHAHHDHDGNVPFLSPKIPLFGTKETLCFYEQKWILDYMGKDGFRKNRHANNEHWRQDRVGFWPLTEGKPVTFLERTKVEAVRVDHSIPGACGFLVQTSDGKTVAISGDFRLHGTNERRRLSERFVGLVRERGPVDLLIVEGTNIDEYSSVVEEARGGWSVKAFIKSEVEQAFEQGGMVVVGVSGNNIERIDSIYEVCRELEARLHLSVYNASVLERLKMTGGFSSREHVANRLLDRDHVVVYERYSKEFYKKFPGDEHGPYVRAPVAEYGKDGVDGREERGGTALKERAVMLLYDGDIELLTRIRPPEGSKYVRSTWEPFNDEQRPDHERLKNWCERFGMTYHHIHASGHAYGAQLKDAVRVMAPRRLVPIHTLERELFGGVLGDLGEVVIVGNGEVLEV